MNNDIVQLTDNSGNNVYPIAGGATQGSISKSMLAEGVFEGPELSPPSSLEYVRTENIVDGAVTSDKIDWTTINYTTNEKIAYYLGGTPVYRKYLEITHTQASVGQLHNHGISNLSKIVNIFGWASATGQKQQLFQRVVPDNISTYGIGIGDIDSTQFGTFLGTGVNRPCTFGLVFEYTKSS